MEITIKHIVYAAQLGIRKRGETYILRVATRLWFSAMRFLRDID